MIVESRTLCIRAWPNRAKSTLKNQAFTIYRFNKLYTKVLTNIRLSKSLHAHFYFDSDASHYSSEYTFPNTWENLLGLLWECHRYSVKSRSEANIQARATISPWPKAWYPVIDGNWAAWHDLFSINPCWLLAITLLSPRKWLQIDYSLICSSLFLGTEIILTDLQFLEFH